MKIVGPQSKLDARYFYTILEAKEYLQSLSADEKSRYLLGELVDFWFMANYSWLFYLVVPKKFVFIPGILDFLETLLILIYLKSDVFYPAMNLLPWISASKWFLASSLTCFILVQLLKKQLKG